MSSPSTPFHKSWIEHCRVSEDIRDRFGLEDAMYYLIAEQLFSFVSAAEQDSDFAAELPAFLDAIRRLFSAAEIRDFLDQLERTILSPQKSDFELDDDLEEELRLQNPVSVAEELLRFFRIRELLLH